jgi:two-component system, NarL family, response regulator LiaR
MSVKNGDQNCLSVMVADDHQAFREGLSRLLSEESDIAIVGQASDGEEAVKLARALHPDVVVLDMAMPKLNGLDAIKKLRAESPKSAILMLSAYGYQSYIVPAIEAGAAGYLLKTVGVREISAAIRSVASGQTVLGSAVSSQLFGRFESPTSSAEKSSKRLQPRELEVVRLVALGLSNKQIANKLGIGERTVQTHLRNILTKLDAGSRTEAVVLALQRGWIALDEVQIPRTRQSESGSV